MTEPALYPNVIEGSASPYFPPLYEKPDCAKCEKRKDCWSCGKYQRDRRDFTYTSGRCPRLPDMRGFVEKDERELYAQTFPLLHAERAGADETLHLYLSLPDAGEKRLKKVYRTYGCWWFRDGKDSETGCAIRRVLSIENCYSPQDILSYMDIRHADYCLFPAIITDGYL